MCALLGWLFRTPSLVAIAALKVSLVAVGVILSLMPYAIAVLVVSRIAVGIFNLNRECKCNALFFVCFA
jgi:uncharacterized membrane protein